MLVSSILTMFREPLSSASMGDSLNIGAGTIRLPTNVATPLESSNCNTGSHDHVPVRSFEVPCLGEVYFGDGKDILLLDLQPRLIDNCRIPHHSFTVVLALGSRTKDPRFTVKQVVMEVGQFSRT